ncbi:MAG TPA: tetratricopeptide repeat protein [Fluviicoccus sp.]|nr:tetratricopeptide repeat protein [Fluviicoccus sp.]
MESLPNCILCNHPLRSATSGPAVEPFWQRYTDFLRVPFAMTGMGILLLLMVLPVMVPDNILLPVAFGSYVLIMLVGWSILLQGATGSVTFPGPAQLGKLMSGPALPLAVVVSLLMTGLGWAGGEFPFVAFVLAVVVACLLPALLMIVGRDKGMTGVVQKDSWMAVFQGVRFLYIPLGGGALALFVFLQALVSLLSDVASPGIVQGMHNGAYGYGVWVIAAVSGYCLLQFQDALGFQAEGARGKGRKSAIRRLDSNTARFEVLLKEGMYDKAVSLLRGQAEKHPNAIDIQERYFQLLVFLKDKSGVAHQGESFLSALLAGDKQEEAMVVLSKILLVMPEYRPEDPGTALGLAKVCAEFREFGRAVQLLDGMHQTSPHFPQLPEAYMLRAKLLHEKLGQSSQALETMEYLVTRFQKHPRYELMRTYWKQLGGQDSGGDFLV